MYKQTSVALEEKMDSRENPVEIERRSQHKSIKELEKEVDSKKSEICKLWRVKEKEKNSWRKKSLEDEVGWCYEHKDFCDVGSTCPTWDPIPANSLEGKLPLAISRPSLTQISMSITMHSILFCRYPLLGHPPETPPKAPQSVGEAQLQNHLAVSKAEDYSWGHEEDHQEQSVALHIVQSSSSPEVNPGGLLWHKPWGATVSKVHIQCGWVWRIWRDPRSGLQRNEERLDDGKMADLNWWPRRKKTLQGRRQDHVVLGKPKWALGALLPLVRPTENHHQPEKNMEKRQKNQSYLGRVDQESGVSIINGKSVLSSLEIKFTFRDFPNTK